MAVLKHRPSSLVIDIELLMKNWVLCTSGVMRRGQIHVAIECGMEERRKQQKVDPYVEQTMTCLSEVLLTCTAIAES